MERITTTTCFEEVGQNEDLAIECEITWELTPAEPMVRYYADGSGYPGSPAMVEVIDVRVTAVIGEDWQIVERHPAKRATERWGAITLISSPDLLNLLTSTAEELVEQHFDRLSEEAFEEAANRDESARESAAESRIEMRRINRMEKFVDSATGNVFDWDR